MASKYYQIFEDDWVPVARKHRHMCCECSLVHDIELRRNQDGTIDMKYTVNRRATAAARKKFGYRDIDR